MGLPSVSSWTVTLPMTFTIAATGKNRLRVRVAVSDDPARYCSREGKNSASEEILDASAILGTE
jgi:hypothetical protein